MAPLILMMTYPQMRRRKKKKSRKKFLSLPMKLKFLSLRKKFGKRQ
jgi:hypothetical protein